MGQKQELAKDLLLGSGEYCFNCRHFCIGNEGVYDYCSEIFMRTQAHWTCRGHWVAGDGRRAGLDFKPWEEERVRKYR